MKSEKEFIGQRDYDSVRVERGLEKAQVLHEDLVRTSDVPKEPQSMRK